MPDFRAVILIWSLAALLAGPWLAGPIIAVNADRCDEMAAMRAGAAAGCGTVCGGESRESNHGESRSPADAPDEMPCKTRCPLMCASCVAPAATLPGSIAAPTPLKFSLRALVDEFARSRTLLPEPHPPRMSS